MTKARMWFNIAALCLLARVFIPFDGVIRFITVGLGTIAWACFGDILYKEVFSRES